MWLLPHPERCALSLSPPPERAIRDCRHQGIQLGGCFRRLIEATGSHAEREGVRNIRLHVRDFVTEGTALEQGSVDYVMLFNILHAEDPRGLLTEACRILAPGGRVGVIHWNCDPLTPRGPPMAIRPRPDDCRRWVSEAGFVVESPHVDLPPYHYGIIGRKEQGST